MNNKKTIYKKPDFYLGEALCEYMLAESPEGNGSDMPIDGIEFQF